MNCSSLLCYGRGTRWKKQRIPCQSNPKNRGTLHQHSTISDEQLASNSKSVENSSRFHWKQKETIDEPLKKSRDDPKGEWSMKVGRTM